MNIGKCQLTLVHRRVGFVVTHDQPGELWGGVGGGVGGGGGYNQYIKKKNGN